MNICAIHEGMLLFSDDKYCPSWILLELRHMEFDRKAKPLALPTHPSSPTPSDTQENNSKTNSNIVADCEFMHFRCCALRLKVGLNVLKSIVDRDK